VTVRYGGVVALDGVALTVAPRQICAVIGPNGAGKTTLFNVVTRLVRPDSGRLSYRGIDLLATPAHRVAAVGITRTFQNLALFPGLTVLENVMVGAHTVGRQGFVTSALRIGTKREERRLRDDAFDVLERLGLAGRAFDRAADLPYGTLKRVELARALAARPSLVLLDEPAGGLTHHEVDELAGTIADLRDRDGLTILLVEHHVRLVMAMSDEVVVLHLGRKIAQGAPDDVQHDRAVVAAYLGDAA
jgi:branched-chain amino acid transport system ATP-binding protein